MRISKRMAKFLSVREIIEGKIASPDSLLARQIGKQKEMLAVKILEELKKLKLIRGFVPPGNLSYSDVERGIDVFVVRVDKKYTVVPLSITGGKWVKKHEKMHPEVPVVEINNWESYGIIKRRIMDVIRQYK